MSAIIRYFGTCWYTDISVMFLFCFSSMVAGIPAQVIGHVHEQDPSLTMKHGMSKYQCAHH